MKQLLIFTAMTISLTVAGVKAEAAAISCRLRTVSASASFLAKIIRIREASVEAMPPRDFQIDGSVYRASHYLGVSRGIAYLGKDLKSGRWVVIKYYSGAHDNFLARDPESLMYEEKAKAEFLSNHGEDYAGVIGSSTQEIVKEYRLGLTIQEIKKHADELGLSADDVLSLSHQLQEMRGRLDRLSGAYKEWYRSHRQIIQIPTRNPTDFDTYEPNFIYDFAKSRWVLIDP